MPFWLLIRRCVAMMTRGEVWNSLNAPSKESNLCPTDRWCPSRWWLDRTFETLLLSRDVHKLLQFSQKVAPTFWKSCSGFAPKLLKLLKRCPKLLVPDTLVRQSVVFKLVHSIPRRHIWMERLMHISLLFGCISLHFSFPRDIGSFWSTKRSSSTGSYC